MYATISDLLRDLFGISIPLPIQTFGFMMALSFMGAYYVSVLELKRMEANGLLKPLKVKRKFNEPITIVDYVTAVIIGAFLGFKLLEMVLDYDSLVANPQKFILSGKGSWFGALLGGVYAYYQKSKEAKALEGKIQETKEVIMHPYEVMGNVVGIAAIGGILGAKIFHNLENIDDLIADPMGSLLSFSGLTFYGGLIVAAVAILYYTGRLGIPNLIMCDATAAALMLSYGMGRIGCQLSGDGDWGIDNLAPKPEWLSFLPDWAWSYKYPNNVLGEGIPIPGCEGAHCNALLNPVFPTPLYEAVACILLFFVLWSVRKRFTIPGTFFLFYLLLNGIERFLIEKIRVNTTYHIGSAHITQAEIISFTFIIGALIGLAVLIKKHKTKTA
ncbi:MAG: prolipoprotein diacylglyceryl transferase [Bacteroidia bacterium]|nr:prolipoprotein diacylglyceryl transferase [Bacteroidia bacterium]MCF8428013.1 prolipoprotein diacylglyceryl transferase [Bacteroidia bacterium]MCF8445737.1 prolipoprotein diacylglyceryl transferase [Bacteroidia bacterium]